MCSMCSQDSKHTQISSLSNSLPGMLGIVCKQSDNNFVSDGQWGFRKGKPTEQLMLSMTEKWKQALDNGKVASIIFGDFHKAFDSICHKKI